MRIAHVISDTNIGGAGRYLLALLPGATTHDWQITVYAPEGALAAALRSQGIARVIPLPQGECSFSFGLWRWLLHRLEPADVVHTHASLAARLVAKHKGYPVVLTRHTLGPDLPPGGYKGWQRWLHRWVAVNLSDAVIAVSEACRQRLLAEGVPESCVRLIYHGIDPTPYLSATRAGWRQRLGLTATEPVLITVARLAPVKGLKFALEAAAILQRDNIPFTWLFVGQGSELSSLQEQTAALGLGQQVRWLGYQTDIPGLMAAADIKILPSLQEALGLVILEAMAAGLPIVASNVGGIPELVQDGQSGILVPPGTSIALASAIKQLLADQSRASSMGLVGRQRVLAQFTITRMWQQTDAVYRQVGGNRRCN
ncbi:MAG: glycosyltransferase family 4 protein [Firmicutes bacterium]|nr:glycosyltransferase family 4 protein [Bacillota bacterium]